ncbi:Prp39p [Nakaseomyces bracarensis]|uniref:Prp39p n=1 Tax=Nakaseomyces bracarensis TaxID=273131 RepID=UPI003871A929
MSGLLELEASFLRENQALVHDYRNVDWESMESILRLVSMLEKTVVKYKEPNNAIKGAISGVFTEILGKYPYLSAIWKKFTAVRYQFDGLEASVATLRDAVTRFPDSIELWCDYLSVLDANNAGTVEERRSKYETASKHVGYHFLSHPFWDKYIKFESDNGQWDNVTAIYKEVLRIPLHQYAKYFKAFMAFNNERIAESDRVTKEVISAQLKKTQTVVNSIWQYEAKIKRSTFTLDTLPSTEITNWDAYLTFLSTIQADNRNELINSVFRRYLIANALDETLWIRYIRWLLKSKAYDAEVLILTYKHANEVLPSSCKNLRLNFLQYLESNYKSSPDSFYEEYCIFIEHLAKMWPSNSVLVTKLLKLIKRHQFGNKWGDDTKEILQQQNGYTAYLELKINAYLKNNYRKNETLTKILNNDNIGVLLVELIKMTWLVLKNKIKTRKLLMQYGKLPIVKNSAPFWILYYEFEKSSKNFVKLNSFIHNLGINIFLPTTIKNDILTDYRDFYLTNCDNNEHQAVSTSSDALIRTLLDINSGHIDSYKKIDAKIPLSSRKTYKENGHPGIITNRPLVKNQITTESSKKFSQFAPALPILKNLEKLNQQPKYADYYTDEYLLNQKST